MPSGFSPMHIFVVLVVALIVLGPHRLMDSARQAGRAMGQFRRWSEEMKDEVRGVVGPMKAELRASMDAASPNGNGAAKPVANEGPGAGATEAPRSEGGAPTT
jgi:TatA/E family protein of Tat protein translocase